MIIDTIREILRTAPVIEIDGSPIVPRLLELRRGAVCWLDGQKLHRIPKEWRAEIDEDRITWRDDAGQVRGYLCRLQDHEDIDNAEGLELWSGYQDFWRLNPEALQGWRDDLDDALREELGEPDPDAPPIDVVG